MGCSSDCRFRRILGEMLKDRVDPVLYDLSRDYVGDTAETVALLWPAGRADTPPPSLESVVTRCKQQLRRPRRSCWQAGSIRLDPTGRWALLKFVTGALRVGVSARLAKTALAEWSGQPLADIEEVWHGLRPPYAELFAWLSGKAERPDVSAMPTFRPLMLSHQIEDRELELINPEDFVAEWKWDGIRVQAVKLGWEARLYSRTGDDISHSFPEIVDALPLRRRGRRRIAGDARAARSRRSTICSNA